MTSSASAFPPFAIAASLNLNTGQTGLVLVSFSPTLAGSFSNSVLFASNAGNSTNPVSGAGATPAVPLARFDASPTNGLAPLAVSFTDTSTGTITNRSWQFGDGTTTNTGRNQFGPHR